MSNGNRASLLAIGRPPLGVSEALSVVAASYDRQAGRIVVEFNNGFVIAFKACVVQGMEGATSAQLVDIVISPSGLGLYFPALDADLYLPAVIKTLLGNSHKWVASAVSRKKSKRLERTV